MTATSGFVKDIPVTIPRSRQVSQCCNSVLLLITAQVQWQFPLSHPTLYPRGPLVRRRCCVLFLTTCKWVPVREFGWRDSCKSKLLCHKKNFSLRPLIKESNTQRNGKKQPPVPFSASYRVHEQFLLLLLLAYLHFLTQLLHSFGSSFYVEVYKQLMTNCC